MVDILYASRALESMPNEGGFILLRDLATAIGQSDIFTTSFFSVRKNTESIPRQVKAFSRTGWSRLRAVEYIYSLQKYQKDYDVVHIAHMPTPFNAPIMRAIAERGRRHHVRYVQTVTALPAAPERLNLSQLLWGDDIVCLNTDMGKIVSRTRQNVKVISAIPDPGRIAKYSMRSPATVLPKELKCIVFPFHFMHLPQGFELVRITRALLEHHNDICIAITYRLNEAGHARALRDSLPEKLKSRIYIIDAQNDVLSYVRHADLLLYPMSHDPRKFNPPLIILEAVALGCSILLSDCIRLPAEFRTPDILPLQTIDHDAWIDAATHLLDSDTRHHVSLGPIFASYIRRYTEIYSGL